MKLTGRARRRAIWSLAAVVLAVAGLVAYGLGRDPGPAPSAATTTAVARGAVTLAVAAAGTVESSQTRGLSFAAAGTVTEVTVKAGDLVIKGQVLARIDPGDAQDAVDSARERLSDAQDAVDRATETANLPSCPTTTATTPAGPGGGSGGGGSTGGSGGSGTATNQNCTQAGRTSTTDALLSAQQQRNNAELAVLRAEARLAGTTITAPIAGRVLSVGGKVGSSVSGGGTGFIVLGDVESMVVRAEFSEADVGRLAVGQLAAIALPDRAEPLTGTVSQIDPAGTLTNRLVRYGVLVAFDDVPADLLLGQSATVRVTTATADDVLYLPSAAVTGVKDGAGTVSVRGSAGDTTRLVKVGLRGDQYTEITAGLTEGEQIVLPGTAS